MLREGTGEPLVLLHGIVGSEAVWREVVPLLAADFDVIAPNALGHAGGPRATEHPLGLKQMVDSAERELDELGLEKPLLAGNSLGGWIALELARRGRAASVCALSPAGTWDYAWGDRERVFNLLREGVKEARRGRRMLPLVARSKRIRRYAMKNAAVDASRLSRLHLLEIVDATLECEVLDELLEYEGEMEPLDPPPCPITLAWAEQDVLFPPDLYGARAQELMPGADYFLLEGVGHIPMLDDPQLVAETIRTASGRPSSASASLSSRGS
jgi:pimeloyl-ACP methyl ester carboxylesterase